MRIVAVADTHRFHDDLVIPEGDVFVHAGDLCGWGVLGELARAAEWMRALPHPHKIVVAGNHDWPFVREPAAARALFDGMHYVQDTELVIDGLRFYGSPWQPEFNNWAFNLPRGEPLAARWRAIPHGIDVLVTHGPPHGYGDRCYHGDRVGCEELLRRIDEVAPRVNLFGHIHEDGGAWQRGATWIANVTTWEGERAPTVFDIDGTSVTPVQVPPASTRAT